MKIRTLLMAIAMTGSVACGGSEPKADAMPTEETAPAVEAPAEEAPAEEAAAEEEAPAEEAAAEDASADGEESGE